VSLAAAYAPDLEQIRGDVETLAALRRSSARPGERESADWLANRLDQLGASDVSIERYRYQPSYLLAHGLHNLAGVLACARGGIGGAVLAVATLLSYEREVSGRSQWLRRVLPARPGANVMARIPASARRHATLLLVAHHDAANTGLVWHPRLVASGAARHLRRRRVDPFMAPLELALVAGALAGLAPRSGAGARWTRLVSAGILGLGLAVDADVGRSPTVPGASDNATGVAVCLDLARALVAAPLPHVEVIVLLPGSEEAGMGGMGAYLAAHAGQLDPSRSIVLGLDTLGAGTPIVCSGEGAMREQRYIESDLRLAEEGSALAGQPPLQRWRIGAWTDPILAVHRGLPAISLLSMGPGYFPHYHHPTDTPEHVDWDSVERCARIAAGTISAYTGRVARA
jgi:hypothetical protein